MGGIPDTRADEERRPAAGGREHGPPPPALAASAPAGAAAQPERGWPAGARAALIGAVTIALGTLFITSYMLTLGHPVPHRIDTAVVGSPTSHRHELAALEQTTRGSVDFHSYPSVTAARRALDAQQVYAALDLTGQTTRLYVASAAGASVSRTLEAAFAGDPQIQVVDTHPLPPSDPQGLDVFYLVLATTILGFTTVFQVRAHAGGLGLRSWSAFVVSFALAASLVLTLVAGPVLHRLDLPIAESWGILALQALTVAAFASTMGLLLGRWAIIPTWLLFVVLGNSSSGGAVSPPLLPRPYRLISQWLPSGATVTSLRNAVYFHADQHGQPVAVLAAWAATCLSAMLVLSRWRGRSPGGA
ncbi:MAG: hypothetical protein QOH16_3387 [Gaiellaceae bacterium]|nr:hypothetical protein [Gaiellaceae bacterium]